MKGAVHKNRTPRNKLPGQMLSDPPRRFSFRRDSLFVQKISSPFEQGQDNFLELDEETEISEMETTDIENI